MKLKLFYSYSHKDKSFREDLAKHLATLRDEKLIHEWYDGEILPGEDWSEEIENNMRGSDIILLLFSQDFISSDACKKEIQMAQTLHRDEGKIFVPIILRECAWADVGDVSKIQALPNEGKPISNWDDKDAAWQDVYKGIKNQVQNIRNNHTPKLNKDLVSHLLKNPIVPTKLNELFVYPDIIEASELRQNLENNEIDSQELRYIKNFNHKYILLEGNEQSGKTSLCRMLFLHYADIDLYPILLNGSDIQGKAVIENIVNKKYPEQYDANCQYWALPKEKRVLLIDDINAKRVNSKNYSLFLKSIKEKFEYIIIMIDKLSNLSDKSTKHDYFYMFNSYTIKPLGYQKRDELIKKCIASDNGRVFSIGNKNHILRLDRDTKYIDTIIGANIVPSHPVFIVSTLHMLESAVSRDVVKTSYGHCYHAMITVQLSRMNVKSNDMDAHFNLLKELSYYIFLLDKDSVSKVELNSFIEKYDEDYVFSKSTFDNLVDSNILGVESSGCFFTYKYIYYYFVAKYISDNAKKRDVKEKILTIMSNLHKPDNSNIIIFVTHHTSDEDLIDDILLNTIVTFDKFTEATLDNNETKFITDYISKLEPIKLPGKGHNPEDVRKNNLRKKDVLKPALDRIEKEMASQDDDPLLVEIRKAAKSMEILGQIMRNQYGTLKKERLRELFSEGQNAGLRALKCFFRLTEDIDSLDNFLQQRLTHIQQENKNKKDLSKEKIRQISGKVVTMLVHGIIFSWLHKIYDSIGYDQLTQIADDVNKETDTVASQLINISIHLWHKKNIDIDKLKLLYRRFEGSKNTVAISLLKAVVARHVYMHKVTFKDKQKINALLGFSEKKQLSLQQKQGS